MKADQALLIIAQKWATGKAIWSKESGVPANQPSERVSRYEIIIKIENYHAETCHQVLQDMLDDYGPEYFKTVTFDNDSKVC